MLHINEQKAKVLHISGSEKIEEVGKCKVEETVKYLGILATNDPKFKEHIEKVTTQSKITMGILLRTFSTREKEPVIKMFNLYIK